MTDTATLRANARKNIEDGAITRTYLADKEVVIKLLNEALATEWVCVLRYYRHYFMASGMLADSVKAEFLEHAQQEQEHANMLAERIVQLGGEPDLNPDTLTKRSHAEYKEGQDLRDMVKEDLIAERIAIDSYREMINYIGDTRHHHQAHPGIDPGPGRRARRRVLRPAGWLDRQIDRRSDVRRELTLRISPRASQELASIAASPTMHR